MRVLRNVVVDRLGREELLAISQAPAITGEDMRLDLVGAGSAIALRVRVLDSRPVIIDGTVRHRIRLAILQQAAENAMTGPAVLDGLSNAAAEAV